MSLTIKQALANSQLDPVEARALMRHVLGTYDAALIMRGGESLAEAQSALFAALVTRRKAGEPVAYIIGTREFFSLEFKVTPAVLIPRPETELLVEFALECIAPECAGRVLDLGTGSGCIAISIARARPRVQIVAVDASPGALAVARENAQRMLGGVSETPSPLTGEGRDGGAVEMPDCSTPALTLPTNPPARAGSTTIPSPPGRRDGDEGRDLKVLQSNWFSAVAGQRFELIVSNPPYVAAGDPHLARGDVLFEPSAALAAGNDGLDCIRLIVASAPQYLNSGGWLAFEHGYDQSARCRELLARAGFTRVFSRSDLAGIERVSGGQWSGRP